MWTCNGTPRGLRNHGPAQPEAVSLLSDVSDAAWLRESLLAITTADGGVRWKKGLRMSRTLPPHGQGHAMEYSSMSSTVRVDAQALVAACSSRETPAKGKGCRWRAEAWRLS